MKHVQVKGTDIASKLMAILVHASVSFTVEPYPEDEYRVSVKDEAESLLNALVEKGQGERLNLSREDRERIAKALEAYKRDLSHHTNPEDAEYNRVEFQEVDVLARKMGIPEDEYYSYENVAEEGR